MRMPLGLLAAVLLVTQIRMEWFLPGLAVSAAGAILQWWCFACIRTGKELAVNGPYRLIRNPMYIARCLLILGCFIFTGRLWAVLAFVGLYYFYMVNRVRREEQKLAAVFGDDYREYCRGVGRFLPSGRPYSGGKFAYFSKECFLRNHGQWNILAVLCFYAVCAWVAFWPRA